MSPARNVNVPLDVSAAYARKGIVVVVLGTLCRFVHDKIDRPQNEEDDDDDDDVVELRCGVKELPRLEDMVPSLGPNRTSPSNHDDTVLGIHVLPMAVQRRSPNRPSANTSFQYDATIWISGLRCMINARWVSSMASGRLITVQYPVVGSCRRNRRTTPYGGSTVVVTSSTMARLAMERDGKSDNVARRFLQSRLPGW
jgi:hypothetical protein